MFRTRCVRSPGVCSFFEFPFVYKNSLAAFSAVRQHLPSRDRHGGSGWHSIATRSSLGLQRLVSPTGEQPEAFEPQTGTWKSPNPRPRSQSVLRRVCLRASSSACVTEFQVETSIRIFTAVNIRHHEHHENSAWYLLRLPNKFLLRTFPNFSKCADRVRPSHAIRLVKVFCFDCVRTSWRSSKLPKWVSVSVFTSLCESQWVSVRWFAVFSTTLMTGTPWGTR